MRLPHVSRMQALALMVALAAGAALAYQALQSRIATRVQDAEASVGEAVFRQNCAACHGPNAEGKDLAPPLNRTGHAHHHPDWELYMVIAEGKVGFGQMPAWKDTLSEHEIRSVVAYIKTLWEEDQRRFQDRVNQLRPRPP